MKTAQYFIDKFERGLTTADTFDDCMRIMKEFLQFTDEEIIVLAREIDQWFADPSVSEEEKMELRRSAYMEFLAMRRESFVERYGENGVSYNWTGDK